MTVPNIIIIAKGSQYLIQNKFQKNGLFGGGLDTRHARKLYLIRKNTFSRSCHNSLSFYQLAFEFTVGYFFIIYHQLIILYFFI